MVRAPAVLVRTTDTDMFSMGTDEAHRRGSAPGRRAGLPTAPRSSWVETSDGAIAYVPVDAGADQLVRAGAAIAAKRCELAADAVDTVWEASVDLPERTGYQALGRIRPQV